MPAKHVYFVGTAGSGKSTLTNAFQLWLNNQGHDAITVNLDPGADSLGYVPDVDVRDWIKLSEVMAEYGLGPNGAQIAAADMMALNIKEISQVVAGFDTDYILLDTPGQIELFTFRQSSKIVMEDLSGDNAMVAFLFDPALAKTPNGYVSSLMLAATVHFRLPVPMISILSKADTLSDAERENIALWSKDYYALFSALLDESIDAQTQVSVEFLQALETVGAGRPVVFVAVDWCEIRNLAFVRWQSVLAEAAGTLPERVMLCTVHQHDAPVADLEAEEILRAGNAKGTVCDPGFHEVAVQRVAQALRASLASARRITHIGLGQAQVERIASNRRYLMPDGSVRFDRTSGTRNELAAAAPENLIDPWLKTLSFWDGDAPIAAVSGYAVHPMSYYGKGDVSADFPGLARRRRQQPC